MILQLLDEAVAAGARRSEACKIIGVSLRTVQRWSRSDAPPEDRRAGPNTPPKNRLTAKERKAALEIVNSPEFRDLDPETIVAILAERGKYVASASSIYRILRDQEQLKERGRSAARTPRTKPQELVAHGPREVWSWDITYLGSLTRGEFFYLYMVVDIWSRKIVGWTVQERECGELAARMLAQACATEGVERDKLSLHSDNGAPMKSANLLTMLSQLGISGSWSRPRVSDDNPYSEALFKTLKYRPEYPENGRFASIDDARAWVTEFVSWYNTRHRHSRIDYVTPEQRHNGEHLDILSRRRETHQRARRANPDRWSGQPKSWAPTRSVVLNPADASRAVSA